MMRQIKVKDLCTELENKLIELGYSEDSMRRYRKVFLEFAEYAGDCDYSQSIGTDFLVKKFNQLGGFVTSGEHSKNEMYYFRVIRSLAEYYNFGILFRRHDFHGEIIWPVSFKKVTENFIKFKVEYGATQKYIRHIKIAVTEFVLFLDTASVEAAEKSTDYLIGILILALKMALYQFFKFKSL